MVAYHAEWRQRDGSTERLSVSKRKRRQRYPERDKANQLVRSALVRGELHRGQCCLADDECSGGIEAHHDDYSKPLAVRWTCRKHHRILDRERWTTTERASKGAPTETNPPPPPAPEVAQRRAVMCTDAATNSATSARVASPVSERERTHG